MKTLELSNRDLVLSNHSFAMLQPEATAKQRISNRLLLNLGEYKYEPESGIDWFQIRGFKRDFKEIQSVIISELRKDPEITSIESVDVVFIDSLEKSNTYQKPLRTVLISLSVVTLYGELRLSL